MCKTDCKTVSGQSGVPAALLFIVTRRFLGRKRQRLQNVARVTHFKLRLRLKEVVELATLDIQHEGRVTFEFKYSSVSSLVHSTRYLYLISLSFQLRKNRSKIVFRARSFLSRDAAAPFLLDSVYFCRSCLVCHFSSIAVVIPKTFKHSHPITFQSSDAAQGISWLPPSGR